MGAAISAARDEVLASQKANKKEILDQLAFLVNSANARLNKYEADLHEMFVNRESAGKVSIPGHRAMRFERGYRVTKTTSADETADGLNDIVESFFGKAKDQEGKETTLGDKVMSGFTKTLKTGLKIFLNNTNSGEVEEQKFFVVAQHNAIVRIDVKLWRYNFSSSGVMAESESVYCYVFCTSVVRYQDLVEDELIYLVSEHAGDDEVEAYISSLLSVRQKIANFTHAFSATGAPAVAALPAPATVTTTTVAARA